MQAAPDPAVLQRAQVDERVLVSADTDFGGLLSRSRATGPSVLLIRRLAGRRAAEQSAIILANLDQIAEDLTAGAVVVIGDDWIRIRRLPMPRYTRRVPCSMKKGTGGPGTRRGPPRCRHTVVIVVGSSSHATHHMTGSVLVSLARYSPWSS